MKSKMVEFVRIATPYMLDNDGNLLECGIIHPYIMSSFESEEEALKKLLKERFESLLWFYENGNKDIKNYIEILVTSCPEYGYTVPQNNIKKSEYIIEAENDLFVFLTTLNNETNQQFCRVSMSSLLFGGTSDEVCFRIGSEGFNWFPLIWQVVYDNKNFISNVTICKDQNVFGKYVSCYLDGKALEHIPVDEFLMRNGNSTIEKMDYDSGVITEASTRLCEGASLSDSFRDLHPRYINEFFERMKEMTKGGIYWTSQK